MSVICQLAPAPADDPADLGPSLRGAGRAGILVPMRKREAAVAADADPAIGLGHRRGDLLFGELSL